MNRKIPIAEQFFVMYILHMNLISAKDAAERLGVSDRRIRAMIKEGKIKAVNVGGGYVIEEKELENVKTFRKAGRPRKVVVEK
jgi:excisionase family DNA binding protein